MANKWQQNPMSAKQEAFIRKLLEQKDVSAEDEEVVLAMLRRGMTGGAASEVIQELLVRNKRKVSARVQEPRADAVVEDGMYRTPGGIIYKVQFNKAQGDGRRLYAKRLVLDQVDTNEWHVKFEYEGGAVRHLTPAMRMTMEQAKEFGALYGTCCVCGRTLTNEVSIEAGIGPVCAGRL